MNRQLLATLAACAALLHHADAASFAGAVVDYLPGTLPPAAAGLTNPLSALGSPAPIVGTTIGFPNVFSPFSPAFESADLAAIGTGGRLTLQLQNYVLIDRTPGVREIGVWENVFVNDAAYPNGTATASNSLLGGNSAVVEVSADNVTWYSLNSGAPIAFHMPGNYFTNAGPYDPAAPASPAPADFGKPFVAVETDFHGKTYPQILALLDGSAGGTWLDLDSVPVAVTQIGFIRFSGASELEIDAVSINAARTGAPVPEPGSLALFICGAAAGATRRFRPSCGA